jgi:agmatinase
MRNALCSVPGITKLVQVGIRDLCEEEFSYALAQKEAVHTCYDTHIARARFEGKPWKETVDAVIEQLPDQVWISLDVDGLDPSLCPSTGTPVPGGLSFNEVVFLIRQLVLAEKKIIGFDLCETAPAPDGTSEWDANVAMRLLYKLCSWTLRSNAL